MEELYRKIDEILLSYTFIHEKAMKACQALGYNGMKRMHRCKAKEFYCLHIQLSNELYDKYRTVLDTNISDFNYKPTNLKEHLTWLDNKMKESIGMLGQYNNSYISSVGKSCGVVETAMGCLVHDYEKTGRWIKRFDESQWSSHDMHYVDDRLHDKYKEIEGG